MKVLVADIGGTHARLAIASPDADELVETTLLTAGLERFEDALDIFFDGAQTSASDLAGAVISGAGPLRDDGSIHMTNGPWELNPKTIQAAHPLPFVRLLNDMTAAALALPALSDDELEQIGGGKPAPDATKAILAPGTGLGVSGLIPHGNNWTPLASEGGHVSLAPLDDREIAVVFHLSRRFGHVSAERILSGPGFETLYETLGALDGAEGDTRLAAVDIMGAARRGETRAIEATHLFSSWLGSVAGDLALTLGAKGGVYIGGGIVPKWGDLFDRGRFRHRFESKGRFDGYLDPIPVFLIKSGDLALRGCTVLARQLAEQSAS